MCINKFAQKQKNKKTDELYLSLTRFGKVFCFFNVIAHRTLLIPSLGTQTPAMHATHRYTNELDPLRSYITSAGTMGRKIRMY